MEGLRRLRGRLVCNRQYGVYLLQVYQVHLAAACTVLVDMRRVHWGGDGEPQGGGCWVCKMKMMRHRVVW